MASFYAELQVAGTTYPVRSCAYEFVQATSERGRAAAKVRHGLVRLTLDVPEDDGLLSWAAAPHKPLAGRVIFRNARGGAALEMLSWEDGQCVGYQETYASGDADAGAYVCHLTIAAPKLTMAPGGPASYASPAAGEHSGPPEALVNPFVVPLLTPTAPVVAPIVETVVEAAAATVLAPVALILALILGSTTPAHAPGLPPVDHNEARLRYLVAQHAAGTLAPGDEAELIALLAKVKGIHVQRLSDLVVEGPLRGNSVPLPGFHNISLAYTKRTDADREALRRKFDSSMRKNFLKKIGTDPAKVDQLKKAGFTDKQIQRIASGKVPSRAWQVHHKLPLDDGGDNSFDNLMLIENDPYHQAITNLQNNATNGMLPGETRVLQWPVYPGFVYPN